MKNFCWGDLRAPLWLCPGKSKRFAVEKARSRIKPAIRRQTCHLCSLQLTRIDHQPATRPFLFCLLFYDHLQRGRSSSCSRAQCFLPTLTFLSLPRAHIPTPCERGARLLLPPTAGPQRTRHRRQWQSLLKWCTAHCHFLFTAYHRHTYLYNASTDTSCSLTT